MTETILSPMSLLAELTHRCPLQCPCCSNPLALEPRQNELSTAEWISVLDQAAEMGVLQVHFSGGEPMSRPDLPELIRHAVGLGLYTNLITSGVLLNEKTFPALVEAGLDHVQLSFQDIDTANAELVGGMKGAQARKIEAARLVAADGMPLTLNFVIYRENAARVPQMLEAAVQMGARRVEIAHTQYYGWGLANREALMPTAAQLEQTTEAVEAARKKYEGRLTIDYVTPDYYADRPKPCMGGWGRRFINISPSGRVLPCHAAETIPNVAFPDVKHDTLDHIWREAPLFTMFRGTDWMPQPCRSCDQREKDWGAAAARRWRWRVMRQRPTRYARARRTMSRSRPCLIPCLLNRRPFATGVTRVLRMRSADLTLHIHARQADHEAGALHVAIGIHAVFSTDGAAQGLDDLLADRQAQAGMLAEILAARPLGIKAVENVVELGLRDAGAFIADRNLHHAARRHRAEQDLAIRRRERDGVADQVAQHLHQPVLHRQHHQPALGAVAAAGHSHEGLARLARGLMDFSQNRQQRHDGHRLGAGA